MRKRIWATVLALCLVLGLVPGTAWADYDSWKEYDLGQVKCKEGYETAYLSYEENEQGGITITSVHPQSIGAVMLGTVPGSLDLTIPDSIVGKPVTCICHDELHDFPWATNVLKIPDTVTTIGEGAFTYCPISGLILPASLTTLDDYALHGINELQMYEIPEGNPNFSSIHGVLFNGEKTHLIDYPVARLGSSYQIPDGVTHVEKLDSENITKIMIPESLESGDFSSVINLTEFTVEKGNKTFFLS